MKKTIKARLGRAHKHIERLTRVLNATQAEILSSCMTVAAPVLAEGVERHARATQRANELLARVKALRAALLNVRTKVAEANCQAGIPQKLAERAVLLSQAQFLEQVVAHAHERSAIALENLEAALAAKAAKSASHYGDQAILVLVPDSDQVGDMDYALQSTQAELDRLNDDINDLNATHQVEFEIDEDIAALIGL